MPRKSPNLTLSAVDKAFVAVLLGGWLLASRVVAGAPDYDTFCDRDGNIMTAQHGLGLMAMLQAPGQVEAIYEDASKGNIRAEHVFHELETSYFPDIGRELAEQVSRPPCLLPAVRELSGWCMPSWSFLDFLDKGKPAGARLRKALFHGYAERARQRNLENQLILSAMNALIGVSVAATAIQEGEVAGSGARPQALAADSDLRSLTFTERDLQKGLHEARSRLRLDRSLESIPRERLQGGGQPAYQCLRSSTDQRYLSGRPRRSLR